MIRRHGLYSVLFSVFLILVFSLIWGESNIMRPDETNVPDSIGPWTLRDSPKRIDSESIFDYMNGAGELYLSYHFDHLTVYMYTDASDNDILVELYQMKESKDAFGLLSLDWGGESHNLMTPDDFPHALYGKGLLRIWSNQLYIRIMATKETPVARDVILRLGKIIVSGRTNPPPPELLGLTEPQPASAWTLRKDSIRYFYSHLVLNSIYYLSHENILNLGHSTEAVMASYERVRSDQKPERAHLLVVRYPDHQQAGKALCSFVGSYLADKKSEEQSGANTENIIYYQIEDGWLGYRLHHRYLALVFGCPDQGSVRRIISGARLKTTIQRRIE